MSQNDKTPSANGFPWKEIIYLFGVFITAYIGYLGIRSQIEIPIQATQTAEARLTMVANTSITTPISTSLPSTAIINPTQNIGSTSVGGSSVEFFHLYYSCINNARNSSELEVCWNFLSPTLQSVNGNLSNYENFYINFRYRYQLFECPGQYNVGVRYIVYTHPDVNFATPIGGKETTYMRYQVDYSNGQWLIEHGYGSYSQETIKDCDILPIINMWEPPP